MIKQLILETLHKEVKVAVGCTEPVAIALAVAHAARTVLGPVTEVIVKISPNIYKNAMNVGIPGTSAIGLEHAAALGAYADPALGLSLLSSLDTGIAETAAGLVEAGKVRVMLLDTAERVRLEATVCSARDTAHAVIRGTHDGLVYLEKSGMVLMETPYEDSVVVETKNPIHQVPFPELFEAVKEIPHEDLSFLLIGIGVNLTAAERGLNQAMGLGVGSRLNKGIAQGYLAMDLANETMIMTASASDARMSGENVPIMTSNGSGNNGITAIIPLSVYAKRYDVPKEKLAIAIALSHLVNGRIKSAIGRLSPMCACGVAASTGASVGLVYLMGGHISEMENTIQIMLSNLSGMICDGAKVGCALKLATSASTAVQSAIMARNGLIIGKGNGILGSTADESIQHLGRIAIEGMAAMDATILSILS